MATWNSPGAPDGGRPENKSMQNRSGNWRYAAIAGAVVLILFSVLLLVYRLTAPNASKDIERDLSSAAKAIVPVLSGENNAAPLVELTPAELKTLVRGKAILNTLPEAARRPKAIADETTQRLLSLAERKVDQASARLKGTVLERVDVGKLSKGEQTNIARLAGHESLRFRVVSTPRRSTRLGFASCVRKQN